MANSDTPTTPHDNPPPTRLAWLARVNAHLSAWAAGLSWWRMALLAIIALIAGNIISDHLQLSHRTRREVVQVTTPQADTPKPACRSRNIMIGGKTAVIISDKGCPSEPPATGASAPASAPGNNDAPIHIQIDPGDIADATDPDEDEPGPREVLRTEHTLGGWIGDVMSALLVAFFAYLIAAKVIVRKTAESDARLQAATASAEREAMQRQLVQARLKLMQAQVEPHFLFNTLGAIDFLIETDPRRASEMQKLLIGYLRAALPQMRQESSTLGRELALIRPYLELLKLRIEDRLSYDIVVPAGLESTVFPPMLLQTLVENAIKHGIEPKPEGGRVSVSAEVADGQLRVQVADTGIGLQTGHIFAASTAGTGLGLDNIRSRLALLYPGQSSLTLEPGHPQGTVVHLSIPYQAQAKSQKDEHPTQT